MKCWFFAAILSIVSAVEGRAEKSVPVTTADVAVIGGGSAGFAAAYAAAKLGSRVVLIEKQGMLGGTSTIGGVNNWEPVIGATGVPFRVYQRLQNIPDAGGVYVFDRHCSWKKPSEPYTFPGGLLKVDPDLPYAKTLLRHGPGMGNEPWFREHCHGVIFEPVAMARVMDGMLRETGRCETLLNTAFVSVEQTNGVAGRLSLSDGRTVTAKIVIDATDGVLCSRMGCTLMKGRDARAVFNEPGAPITASSSMNGVTLIYRVTPAPNGVTNNVDALPEGIPSKCWWGSFPYVFACMYPNGDIGMNMLPTMAGQDAAKLGEATAYAECVLRVRAHWHWLQTSFSEFRRYTFKSISPVLAWRETRRVSGEYVLTQNDLIAGVSRQKHHDIIAIADHCMDSHGGGGVGGELREEYGIPYRCLLPKGTVNVLIAGRAASFSAIAASSCRLSRTMMQLGEAAGVAAYLSVSSGLPLRSIPAGEIRRLMREKIDGDPFSPSATVTFRTSGTAH